MKDMKKPAYRTPESDVMEIRMQGILCSSNENPDQGGGLAPSLEDLEESWTGVELEPVF